jgi:hypothetical protein
MFRIVKLSIIMRGRENFKRSDAEYTRADCVGGLIGSRLIVLPVPNPVSAGVEGVVD